MVDTTGTDPPRSAPAARPAPADDAIRADQGLRRLSRRGCTVVIAGEQWLVTEAVRTALATHGHSVRSVGWPTDDSTAQSWRGEHAGAVQVGLLISDLDRWSRVRAACLVLNRIATRWVVITGAPRGPVWGAVLDAGALTVLPADTSLDDTHQVLSRVAADGAGMPPAEREPLRQAWLAAREERQLVRERLRSLSPREREVLRLLYSGQPVAVIAARFGISPATVRSQVKSVLRKLDVNSQLGAVAALGWMLRLDHDLPLVP